MLFVIVLGIVAYASGCFDIFKYGICIGGGIAIIKGIIEGASSRPARRGRRMGLVERWRDEERRMSEAEEAEDEDALLEEDEEEEMDEEDFEDADDDAVIPVIEADVVDDADVSRLVFNDASEDDDEDASFCEKELSRLYKVRNGLEVKAARMLFVCHINDYTLSSEDRAKRMEKLEATKAWRGLQFDLNYVTNEINGLEEYIKREGA